VEMKAEFEYLLEEPWENQSFFSIFITRHGSFIRERHGFLCFKKNIYMVHICGYCIVADQRYARIYSSLFFKKKRRENKLLYS